ncbi:MAG TPA: hypothetical protein GX706_01280, partial [Candidatus Moranbacteria bacterium]|nr:hypothetical protein [Candidatus Moranbacteria bacterium]
DIDTALDASQVGDYNITFTATDSNNNQTTGTVTIHIVDTTAPEDPIVQPVTSQDTEIKGQTEANVSVLLFDAEENLLQTTTSDQDGNFSFTIEKQQPGTIFYLQAIDEYDNKSQQVKTVVIDASTPTCGSAAQTYQPEQEQFQGEFCEQGALSQTPTFPEPNQTTTWQCQNEINQTVDCAATRLATPTPDPTPEPTPEPISKPEPEKKLKACTFDKVTNITPNSVTLKTTVDKSYKKDKLTFRIEQINQQTNQKEIKKIKATPNKKGEVTLVINQLNPDTQYKLKLSYLDKKYHPCKKDKTVTTKKTTTNFLPALTKTEEVTEEVSEETPPSKEEPAPEPIATVKETTPLQTNLTAPIQEKKESRTFPLEKIATLVNSKAKAILPLGIATGFLATILPFLATTPLATKDLFTLPVIGIFNRRRKQNSWGVVFEQETKQPLQNISISLINEDGKKIATTYSDQQGRYGFLPEPGKYTIQIDNPHFSINAIEQDELYGDTYSKQVITVGDEPITLNISLTPLKQSWIEHASQQINKEQTILYKSRQFLFTFIYYLGFLWTIIATILYPSKLNIILLILYSLFFLYDRIIKKKNYGTIKQQDNSPVPFILLSLTNPQTNQREAFAVTDTRGRYYLLANNGDYNLSLSGKLLDGDTIKETTSVNINKGLLKEDWEV